MEMFCVCVCVNVRREVDRVEVLLVTQPETAATAIAEVVETSKHANESNFSRTAMTFEDQTATPTTMSTTTTNQRQLTNSEQQQFKLQQSNRVIVTRSDSNKVEGLPLTQSENSTAAKIVSTVVEDLVDNNLIGMHTSHHQATKSMSVLLQQVPVYLIFIPRYRTMYLSCLLGRHRIL